MTLVNQMAANKSGMGSAYAAMKAPAKPKAPKTSSKGTPLTDYSLASYKQPTKLPSPKTMGSYTVRSGDSLGSIAKRYGYSLDALIDANLQIRNPNLIVPGQKVNLPGSTPSKVKPAPGDDPFGSLGTPAKGSASLTGGSGKPINDVTTLQHFLKNHGYPSVVVDGIYGPQTAGAKAAYEKAHGKIPGLSFTPKQSANTPSAVIPSSYKGPVPKGAPSGMPGDQWAAAVKYGKQYGVDPRVLAAIGAHETKWGTLGDGRNRMYLGYGSFDAGSDYGYAGIDGQYGGAARTLAKRGVHTLEDLANYTKNHSWPAHNVYGATDPGWNSGVIRWYRTLFGG